jgi:peroxiredoxin
LADYQAWFHSFEQRKVKVIAASADGQEDAQKMIDAERLGFPVAYGLQAHEFAGQTGAFFNAQKDYLHATGFLLDPSGTVLAAVYSTGAIGRLTASDALGTIVHLQKSEA